MKDYPFIKFTLAFIIGILASELFQYDLHYYPIIIFIFIFIILLLTKHFRVPFYKIISPGLSIILIFIFGLFIAKQGEIKIESPLINYQKEKNTKLYAQVIDVELERSFEIVFTASIDSIFIDNKLFTSNDLLIEAIKRIKKALSELK